MASGYGYYFNSKLIDFSNFEYFLTYFLRIVFVGLHCTNRSLAIKPKKLKATPAPTFPIKAFEGVFTDRGLLLFADDWMNCIGYWNCCYCVC